MNELAGLGLSLLCGFGPMFFLAGVIYWLDRYEKEPLALLGGVFGWGAVVAVFGALGLQLVMGKGVLALTGSEMVEEIAGSSIFAPLTEEVLKGLAVLLVFLSFRYEFDSLLDGIVYAAIAALGFAATEDMLYYYSAYMDKGVTGMFSLVFLRFVIFGWQHAFFTSFTGIGLAAARLNRNPLVKVAAPLAGLSVAIFAHSLHNTLLIFANNLLGLVAAAILAWMGWLAIFAFIVWLIYREKTWLAEYLRDEVELATITAQQYRSACSFFGQTKARLAALTGGSFRRTARFYQLCAELAQKKRQLARLGEETGNNAYIAALRAELSKISPMV